MSVRRPRRRHQPKIKASDRADHMLKSQMRNAEEQTLPATQTERTNTGSASIADIRALSDAIKASLEDDKAEDITIIDLTDKSSLADVMIIASGRSARHVSALADHLARKVKEKTGTREI